METSESDSKSADAAANGPVDVQPNCSEHGGASTALRFLIPLALVVLIGLAYMPALDAGFVDWDDDDLVILNTRHYVLNGDSLRWMFTTSFAGHFQPLTWLSYHLDWRWWGHQPFGYHLTNVLLHVLTTLVFYFLARLVLALSGGDGRAHRSRPILVSAGFAAALFALHPLRVESVAWIAERRDVLSGLFYALTIAFYVRYAATTNSSRAPYAASVACCVLSLLAKASAITLPLVLLILDWYPLRRFRCCQGQERPETLRVEACAAKRTGYWIDKLPFAILAMAAAVRALSAQDEGGALYGLAQHDIASRLAQACYGLVFYAWKTLWPTNLGPLYEIPPASVLFGSMMWGSIAAIGVTSLAAFTLRRRTPAIAATLAVYVAILLPVLGIAQSGPQLVADRYSYLSCAGFALLAGGLVLRFMRSEWTSRPVGRSIAMLVLFGVPMLLAKQTFQQSAYWQSAETLWAHGIQVSPNSAVARVNLADVCAKQGDLDRAAIHFERALKLDPIDPIAHHHYADLQTMLGNYPTAAKHFAISLRIAPDRASACFSFARTLMELEQPQQAVRVLRDGAQRRPDALEMIDYLADLISTHPDESIRSAEEAVRLSQHVNRANGFENAQTLLTLATAYANAGQFEEAVSTAKLALRVRNRTANDRLTSELSRRLELFRAKRPYHFGD